MFTTGWMATSWVTMPMKEMTRLLAPDGIPERTKVPFVSVMVPVCVPFTMMETPGSASPFSSVMVPLTVDTCAKAVTLMRDNKNIPISDSLVRNFAFIKVGINK